MYNRYYGGFDYGPNLLGIYIRKGYRRCVCGSDSIFYRINNDVVEIMAIIGKQDLNKIL